MLATAKPLGIGRASVYRLLPKRVAGHLFEDVSGFEQLRLVRRGMMARLPAPPSAVIGDREWFGSD